MSYKFFGGVLPLFNGFRRIYIVIMPILRLCKLCLGLLQYLDFVDFLGGKAHFRNNVTLSLGEAMVEIIVVSEGNNVANLVEVEVSVDCMGAQRLVLGIVLVALPF